MASRKVKRKGHKRRTKTADVWVSEHLVTVGRKAGALGAAVITKASKRAAVLAGEKARGFLERRKRKKQRIGPRKFRGKGVTVKPRVPYPHKGRTL